MISASSSRLVSSRSVPFRFVVASVSQELGNMILSTEKMKLFTKVDDEDKDVLGAYCEALVELPSVSGAGNSAQV